MDQIEAAWAHRLGEDHFAQLVALLRDLAGREEGAAGAARDGVATREAIDQGV